MPQTMSVSRRSREEAVGQMKRRPGRPTELQLDEMREALDMLDQLRVTGFTNEEILSGLGYQSNPTAMPRMRQRLAAGRGGLSRGGFQALKELTRAEMPGPLEEPTRVPQPAPEPRRQRGAENLLEAFEDNARTLRSLERRMEEQRGRFGTKLTDAGVRQFIAKVSALAREFEEVGAV